MPAVAGAGVSAEATAAPARGRHRAPTDPGRHRTADTGFLAVVPVDESAAAPGRRASGRAGRTESFPPVRHRESWTAPDVDEPDLLTRPMRLSDYEANSRRPRVNGSVARV
jgi:hypothetical protein